MDRSLSVETETSRLIAVRELAKRLSWQEKEAKKRRHERGTSQARGNHGKNYKGKSTAVKDGKKGRDVGRKKGEVLKRKGPFFCQRRRGRKKSKVFCSSKGRKRISRNWGGANPVGRSHRRRERLCQKKR